MPNRENWKSFALPALLGLIGWYIAKLIYQTGQMDGYVEATRDSLDRYRSRRDY